MKVQCSCGVKFAFEITPEMTTNPVRFVCPACGLDASEFVDGLVRRELGQTSTPAGRVVSIDTAAHTVTQFDSSEPGRRYADDRKNDRPFRRFDPRCACESRLQSRRRRLPSLVL